jgi:hypothetical protein
MREANREEKTMSNQAASRIQIAAPDPGVRARIDANRAAVARAEQAQLHAAVDGQRWERRGVLRRLRRVPALRAIG